MPVALDVSGHRVFRALCYLSMHSMHHLGLEVLLLLLLLNTLVQPAKRLHINICTYIKVRTSHQCQQQVLYMLQFTS